MIRKEQRLIVHLLNQNNGPVNYSVNFSGEESFQLKGGRLTDPLKYDAEIDQPNSEGQLPPYSLTTLIFESS